MKTSTEEIQHLLQLIKAERDEEIKQYEQLIKETSIGERRKRGITWYPVQIVSEEIGLGEQYVLEIQRTSLSNEIHQFQSGQTAAIFSNAYEGEHPMLQGVIKKVRDNSIWLVVRNSDLPDWLGDGKLGVDLLYNETTYREMELTLQKLLKARDSERLGHLREVLLGYREPSFYEKYPYISYPDLNDSQNLALRQIAIADDIAIVHGPPGTGKTTTLVRAIQHVIHTEKQVLVAAPSNTAVDLLSLKLFQKGVRVTRIGHPARVEEELQHLTLDAQITKHPDYKRMVQTRKEALQLKLEARKFKRNFGKDEREERKHLESQSRLLLDYARQLEIYILNSVLDQAEAITVTLVGAAQPVLRDRMFSTVFIDEAAQALEPATWIPILKAKRVIFAGDHCQLPPTVKSAEAIKKGLNLSLFEKSIKRTKAHTMLQTQYRMNEKIMRFSSEEFYQTNLSAHPSVSEHTLTSLSDSIYPELSKPFEFIDTAGCGFEEVQNPQTMSFSNPQEATLLLKYLSQILESIEFEQPDYAGQVNIGIIAPYKEQVRLIETEIMHYETLVKYLPNISIDTVDGFQGQERDIIAMSLVRSNDRAEIGFLADVRRTNVAMTRARKKLVISADSATLAIHPFYQKLLDYVDKIGAYRSAWELMY
ncbi:MAG: AAA family ATPase [Sphingobacteriales bacterium]|nr:MAG: AAA family ATPase [Sphingobacteriales bacterium]